MQSGGRLLVQCLEAQGVTAGFGVPGESYLDVLDALADSAIEFVCCRQEGGAAYSASAWGRLTGKPGVVFVTRGPGATNASVGLHTAMQDSSPLVMFVGQASLDHLGREAFQEVDYRAFFGPLVKWATQIESADRIPEIVSRAFMTAQSGRPGPVVVALPEDVLSAQTSAIAGGVVAPAEPAPSPAAIDEVAQLLSQSVKPVVIVGAGGSAPFAQRDALGSFAEANDIPVLAAFRSHDLIDNHSRCYAGDTGVGMFGHVEGLLTGADLIIGLGIRFDEAMTKAYTLFDLPDAGRAIIHVHPSGGELGKIIQPTIAVQSGTGPFLEALSRCELTSPAGRATWRSGARSAHVESMVAPTQPGALDMSAIMQWLQQNLPPDVIITNGAGNFAAWPNKYFSYGPDARLLGPESGSMGYALPAAIAAKVAEPARTVVAFTGDGDFQMNIQELGTAAQAGAQPIVLVLNNGMYGTIRMHQERTYPGRVSGTDIVNPDFVAIAEAYGFRGERVAQTDDFAAAFERALDSHTGAVLELMLNPSQLTATVTIDDLVG